MMSACSDNQSTILPLPSSPHWAPTTTTLAMRRFSSVGPGPGSSRRYKGLPQCCPSPEVEPRKALIHSSPQSSTADDSALYKAVSLQDQGGGQLVGPGA